MIIMIDAKVVVPQINTKRLIMKYLEVIDKVLTFASSVPAKPLYDAQMCGALYFIQIWPNENSLNHFPFRKN